ncbi:hypothetical protein BC834DRAFT_335425 [Gloeopeniophorella convolvens]|nr:hypothetical protein BC834DRAFT_335425 [Gloeopeniophorella convolvens]
MKVLLTGGTGVAGLAILRTLLADNGVSHVTYLGRRALPSWVVLPDGTPANDSSPTHPKLSTIVHTDFLTYPPVVQDAIAEHDACIWALGISTTKTSEEKYTEITVGYLDAFLDVLQNKTVGTPENPYRVVFVSGGGTDSQEKSKILFARVKGKAENNLRRVADESEGRIKAIVMRPGYFYASREHKQDARNQRGLTERLVDTFIGRPFELLYPKGVIKGEEIGKFAMEAARGRWDNSGGPIFENPEMKDMLKGLKTSSTNREDL